MVQMALRGRSFSKGTLGGEFDSEEQSGDKNLGF
jgi:hypothetical protein